MKQHLGEVEITSFQKMSDKKRSKKKRKVGKHPQVIWDCLQVPVTTLAVRKTFVPMRDENVLNRRPWQERGDSALAVLGEKHGLLIASSTVEPCMLGGSRLVLFMVVMLNWPVDNDHAHLPPGRTDAVVLFTTWISIWKSAADQWAAKALDRALPLPRC